MDLKKILKKLSIEGEFFGKTEFDTLGVSNEQDILNFCTFIDNINFVESYSDNVSVILTTKELEKFIKLENKVIVKEPRNVFFKIHDYLINSKNCQYIRKQKKTVIGKNCKISNCVDIAENNVNIGNNVTIEPFVSIKENVVIEDNVVIRSGVVIGGEGFEVKKNNQNNFVVAHGGGVILKCGVEIQQNTAIDKGLYPWDNTIIGDYTKVANSVCISHGVKTGKNCMITGGVAIGGRTVIGDNCYIGLSSALKQLLKIGNNANISMGAVVSQNVPENGHVTGNLAIDHERMIAHIKSIK